MLWDSDPSSTDTLKKLTSLLKSRFSGHRQADKYRMELRLRRRRAGESLSKVHQDIRRLMALAHPTLPQEARETIACDYFIDALDDVDFALNMRERAPESLDEALRVALRLESWAQDAKRKSNEAESKARSKVRGAGGADGEGEIEERLPRLETSLSRRLDELLRLKDTPQPEARSGVWEKRSPSTEALKSDSRYHEGSLLKESAPKAVWPQKRNTGRPYQVVCFKCKQPGHYQRDCNQAPTSKEVQDATPLAPVGNSRGTRGIDRADVYLMMKLCGKEVPCLMDTGCEITMVPKVLTDKHLQEVIITPTKHVVYAANNTKIAVEGQTILPFVLNGQRVDTFALVSADVEEVMIGADWLKEHGCLWDFSGSRLFVDRRPAVTLSRKRHLQCRRLYLAEDVLIPPRQQLETPATSTLLSLRIPGGTDMVENRQLRPGVFLGRALLPKRHRDLKVKVVNTTTEPTVLRSGTWLGNLCPATVMEGAKEDMKDVPKRTQETLMSQLPEDLTASQRSKVAEHLDRFNDIFSKDKFDMGRTSLVEHSIDTGDQRPIRQGLRRHPKAHLDQQVQELIKNDFVEPSASPSASNVVLVRKKDGSHRLCVDYRAVNSVTYKDAYPLPHIDTCLGSMDGAVWFSALDLRLGYHNIPIKEADRDKTAFITRRGCFRYKVLPFGLSTAPSVFQRLMDLVLCGLTYESCLVYLDDIIVFAKEFDTHVKRLEEVFERLRAANLKLHATKCCFFQRQVAFLGHVISQDGIGVQEEKVTAVQNWPVPRDLTEVRSFLGLCSYYRRFIAGFADIAAPLHRLMRKEAKFHWEEEQDQAFEELKRRLTSAPILGMPTNDGSFIVDSDASNIGLGAVLSQEQDG